VKTRAQRIEEGKTLARKVETVAPVEAKLLRNKHHLLVAAETSPDREAYVIALAEFYGAAVILAKKVSGK
jgi:hypothetical protein